MRDIWYRRVVAGVLLASAAVLAIGRRLRPRPAPQSDRPVPSTTPPARLTLQTTCAPSILQNHATPIGAAWFATACGLCLAAAAAVSSMQAPTFHNLASIFDLTAIGFALGGIITIGWRLRTRARHWPLWSWRFSGLCATIILAFVAADTNFHATELEPDKQLVSTLLWVLAVIVAFASAWPRHAERAVDEAPATRREVIALIGIVALAFALRTIDLDQIPRLVLGDETKYSVAAEYLTTHVITKPFTTGTDGHWNLYLMITGMFVQLFGASVAAIRLPSAIAGTLSVVATYAVVRQLWGRRPALIAAALLTTYHHHLHFSRVGFNSIDDPLFSMLVFACLWLAWRTGRRRAWLMTALAAGLSQYFFVGGRLVLIQMVVMAVFWLITNPRRVRTQALNIALATGVFVCIVTPILYFIVIRPDDYMGSLNNKNIYRSGWLQAQMQATGQSEGEVLLDQFTGVLTAAFIGSDESFYWQQAMLTPIMSVLAVLALLYFIRRIRAGPYFWLISALVLLFVFGGLLVVSPTAGAHRLLGSGPLIYAAIAVLLDRALSRLEQWWFQPRRAAAAGAVLVALLMIADLHYYFVDYLNNHELDSPEVAANDVHRYLIGVQSRFTQGPIEIACVGFNANYCQGTNLQYLAPQLLARAEVLTDLGAIASVPPPGVQPQIVIINSALGDEIQRAQQRYSSVGSEWHYGPRGDLEFVSFEIPAAR